MSSDDGRRDRERERESLSSSSGEEIPEEFLRSKEVLKSAFSDFGSEQGGHEDDRRELDRTLESDSVGASSESSVGDRERSQDPTVIVKKLPFGPSVRFFGKPKSILESWEPIDAEKQSSKGALSKLWGKPGKKKVSMNQ